MPSRSKIACARAWAGMVRVSRFSRANGADQSNSSSVSTTTASSSGAPRTRGVGAAPGTKGAAVGSDILAALIAHGVKAVKAPLGGGKAAYERKKMIRVGVGGWDYDPWRQTFYPPGLSKARMLDYAARQLTAIEINATYYKL